MIRVELIGLPGAGKTTVCERVVARLRCAGVRVMDRSEQQALLSKRFLRMGLARRGIEITRYFSTHGSLLRAGARLAASVRPPVAMSWWRLWCLVRMAHNDSVLRGLAAPDVLLLDQSILQEIWCVLYLRRNVHPELLHALLCELEPSLPEIVVDVRSDAEVALARLRERARRLGPQTDLDHMPDLDAATMELAGAEASSIARAAARVARAERVELDGSASLEQEAETLASVILRRLRQPEQSAHEQGVGAGERPSIPSKEELA